MILDTVQLENFGVYRNSQTVTLTPHGDGRAIVLFGGLNGCGKTTFLDAVQLAFFGANARCSGRGKLSYKDYLRNTIHRDTDPAAGASVGVAFRRMIDGKMRSYHVSRSWRVTPSGVKETVESSIDGRSDVLLAQHWDEYIESYIPSGISHLFFFDAEQIKDLAENERSAEIIGTAVSSLLGLELLTQLETDLIALERRKKSLKKNSRDVAALRVAQQDVERLDLLLDQVTQERGHIATQVDTLAKQLSSIESQFEREGGSLFDRRKQMEDELVTLERELVEEERALRHLLAGPAPLIAILPLLKQVESQATVESAAREAAVVRVVLEKRDRELTKQLQKRSVPLKVIDTIGELLRDDRARRNQKSQAIEPWLLAEEHTAEYVRHLRSRVLPEVANTIRTHSRARAHLKERISRLEHTLARVPERESISLLQREINVIRGAFLQKKAELEAVDAKQGIILQERNAAAKRVESLLDEHASSALAVEDNERVLKHATKVRATLVKLRKALITKHAARIERLMLDSFLQLLRKGNLIGAINIDPETYEIQLRDQNGRHLAFDRLSAGERQLLATSLLWGLARASGRPLPTIIDTPLGRLDSSHRDHLVTRYFPIASHQVILLSTDKEIDELSLQQLRPYIGRTYRLEFDERNDSTTVQPGYFWQYEAAC